MASRCAAQSELDPRSVVPSPETGPLDAPMTPTRRTVIKAGPGAAALAVTGVGIGAATAV